MTSERLEPISLTQRIDLLDVLRGFALIGVAASNIHQVATDRMVVPAETLAQLPTASIDVAVSPAILGLIYGKFMMLFGMIFGLGIAVQDQRAEAKGTEIGHVIVRRMGALLLIGLAHLFLLWWGDVLHVYAFAGCLLLVLRRSSDKTLLVLGLALSLLPITVIWTVGRWLNPNPTPRSAMETSDLLPLFLGDYFDVLAANLALYKTHFSLSLSISLMLWALGHFLLGYLVGRSRILHDPTPHLAAFKRAARWGLAIGLPLNVYFVGFGRWWLVPLESPWRPLASISFYVGFLALATFYVSMLTLLFQKPGWRRQLLWLAPVGRMALTNYLSYSVFYVLLFTGAGLGLLGKIGATFAALTGLAFFALQVHFSRWWLKRFRFGPVEWLWRSMAYGKLQPMAIRNPGAGPLTP